MNDSHFIGFDRKIELDWLDRVAAKAAAGSTRPEVQAWLYDELLAHLGAKADPHGARGKTATVLMRIWFPQDARALARRDAALAELPAATPEERVALHWAMAMVAYPFFGEVVRQIGRLTALQGETTAREVTRRVAEQFGDRSTLPRAVNRVIQSVANWGVVRIGDRKLTRAMPVELSDGVGVVLVDALTGRTNVDDAVKRDPAGFPFSWTAGR